MAHTYNFGGPYRRILRWSFLGTDLSALHVYPHETTTGTCQDGQGFTAAAAPNGPVAKKDAQGNRVFVGDPIPTLCDGFYLKSVLHKLPGGSWKGTKEDARPMAFDAIAQEIFDTTNAYRDGLGLEPFLHPSALQPNHAATHVANMIDTGILAHDDPAFPPGYQTTLERIALYAAAEGGAENLAYYPDPTGLTGAQIVSDWAGSPGHNANMIAFNTEPDQNRRTYLFTATGLDENGGLYAAQVFVYFLTAGPLFAGNVDWRKQDETKILSWFGSPTRHFPPRDYDNHAGAIAGFTDVFGQHLFYRGHAILDPARTLEVAALGFTGDIRLLGAAMRTEHVITAYGVLAPDTGGYREYKDVMVQWDMVKHPSTTLFNRPVELSNPVVLATRGKTIEDGLYERPALVGWFFNESGTEAQRIAWDQQNTGDRPKRHKWTLLGGFEENLAQSPSEEATTYREHRGRYLPLIDDWDNIFYQRRDGATGAFSASPYVCAVDYIGNTPVYAYRHGDVGDFLIEYWNTIETDTEFTTGDGSGHGNESSPGNYSPAYDRFEYHWRDSVENNEYHETPIPLEWPFSTAATGLQFNGRTVALGARIIQRHYDRFYQNDYVKNYEPGWNWSDTLTVSGAYTRWELDVVVSRHVIYLDMRFDIVAYLEVGTEGNYNIETGSGSDTVLNNGLYGLGGNTTSGNTLSDWMVTSRTDYTREYERFVVDNKGTRTEYPMFDVTDGAPVVTGGATDEWPFSAITGFSNFRDGFRTRVDVQNNPDISTSTTTESAPPAPTWPFIALDDFYDELLATFQSRITNPTAYAAGAWDWAGEIYTATTVVYSWVGNLGGAACWSMPGAGIDQAGYMATHIDKGGSVESLLGFPDSTKLKLYPGGVI